MFSLIEDDDVYLVTVPGWGGSGDTHWQSRWEKSYPLACRAELPAPFAPERDAWRRALSATLDSLPGKVVLVAHSLGCHTAVDWLLSRSLAERRQAQGLLLVAPPQLPIDPAVAAASGVLAQGAPLPPFAGFDAPRLQTLPCPCIVVSSRNDPFCPPAYAKALVQGWGAQWVDAGDGGHLGEHAGLGAWPAGQKLLQTLMLG